MPYQKTLIAVTCPALLILTLFLAACNLTSEPQTDRMFETTANSAHATEAGPQVKLPDKIAYNQIPQTGQKRSYAAGDDGNVRIGRLIKNLIPHTRCGGCDGPVFCKALRHFHPLEEEHIHRRGYRPHDHCIMPVILNYHSRRGMVSAD